MRRILTIDGGGIKGVFPAAFLATIEDCLGEPIADYFDLVAGTSTGGIIALGLGLGFTAKEILAFYESLGPRIFRGNRLLGGARWLTRGKYRPVELRSALNEQFGDRQLGESKVRLVIPSLNLETGEVHIYKTSHHPRFELDYREAAVDVAMATAAAPTYFPAHRAATGLALIDGGIWANNPVGVAVVEAISVLQWPADGLLVLTLGCTNELLGLRMGPRLSRGATFWLQRIVDVFMTGQSSAALGTAYVIAGHERVVRISPMVPRGRFSMDGCKHIADLKGLGFAEGRKAVPQLKPVFFDGRAEPFAPFHRL